MAAVEAEPVQPAAVEGLIAADDYGIIASYKKGGKSFAALDLAVSKASGTRWLNMHQCCRGRALYFVGEGGKRKTLRRLRAFAAAKGLTEAEWRDLPLGISFKVPYLAERDSLREFKRVLLEQSPDMVILDPLYLAAKGGNLRDLYAMGELLGNAQAIVQSLDHPCALIVFHHFKKGADTGDNSGSQPARVQLMVQMAGGPISPLRWMVQQVSSAHVAEHLSSGSSWRLLKISGVRVLLGPVPADQQPGVESLQCPAATPRARRSLTPRRCQQRLWELQLGAFVGPPTVVSRPKSRSHCREGRSPRALAARMTRP